MSHRKIALVLLAGLALVLAGCIDMQATDVQIFCDSVHVEGITSTVANFSTGESFWLEATVTRVDDSTVLYRGQRVLVQNGKSLQDLGFTSDTISFPAVPEGTVLTIFYGISTGAYAGLTVVDGETVPETYSAMSYSGACRLAAGDPTPEPTDEPTEEPTDEPPVTPTPIPWQPEWWSPGDDRLNPDPHAYAAVYCDATNERVLIYGVNSPGAGNTNDGSGFFAIQVPYSDLPPTPTDANVLIAEFENIRFYRTIDGEFMVIAGPDFEGKEYVVAWDGCPMSNVQRYILQGDRLQRTG